MRNKYCLERHLAINENNFSMYFNSRNFFLNSIVNLEFMKVRPILGEKKKHANIFQQFNSIPLIAKSCIF